MLYREVLLPAGAGQLSLSAYTPQTTDKEKQAALLLAYDDLHEGAAQATALALAADGWRVFLLRQDTPDAGGIDRALALVGRQGDEWHIDSSRFVLAGMGAACDAVLAMLARGGAQGQSPCAGLLVWPQWDETPAEFPVLTPLFIWTEGADIKQVQASLALTAGVADAGGKVALRVSTWRQSGDDKGRAWLAAARQSLALLWQDPLEAEAQQTGRQPESATPQQYYENIYRDRMGMFRHSPFALEQQLTKAVTQGDEQTALNIMRRINAQGDKAVLAADPLRSARNSVICSCTFLTRAVIQGGVPSEEAFALSDAVIQHVETLPEKQAVLGYETDMLLQFIGLVWQKQQKDYSSPVRRALHYIDTHLDRAVSLSELAAYAKVHPNYLSRRFKQETGSTITTYSAERKIQESTYFVQHTAYPMAEIAALYGFSSQSYFISTFKKVLGMPPGKFRDKNEMLR